MADSLPSGTPVRELSRWERLSPWLGVGVASVLGLPLLIWGLPDPARNLRGYTPGGLVLGAVALVFVLVSALYSARKRSLQEPALAPWPRAVHGSMASWLNAHLVLGALAAVAAVLHAGYGLLSRPTWGTLALLTLVAIVLSGVVWRRRYDRLPRQAMGEDLRSWSLDDAAGWIDRRAFQIRQLAAGGSEALREFAEHLLAEPPRLGAAERLHSGMLGRDRELAERIRERADKVFAWQQRSGRIAEYKRRLRALRLVHVPAMLLLLLALPLHLVFAFDVPQRVAPAVFGGFDEVQDCAACHERIVHEWEGSMHAHGTLSPVTAVQNNQVVRRDNLRVAAMTTGRFVHPGLDDPTAACVNCHGPVGARLGGGLSLPYDEPLLGGPVQQGVDCAACHQFDGQPSSGGAAARAFVDALLPGRLFFGGIDDPIGNAYHRTRKHPNFDDPNKLCHSCHNVVLDLNGDGRVDEKGTDLVLQTLWDENDELRRTTDTPGCVDCHMGGLEEVRGRAAETASVPFEQDFESAGSKQRRLSDHSFVAVDYPLDQHQQDDPHDDKRKALLRSSASLELAEARVSSGGVDVTVRIVPGFLGHNLPSGFAFARQLWVELVVEGEDGTVLASSGRIGETTDDLCDASSLVEASIRPHMQGCEAPDTRLVNLQAKLVDKVRAKTDANGTIVRDSAGQAVLEQHPEGREVVTQWLEGGAVARVRPADGKALTPIPPGGVGEWEYSWSTSELQRRPRAGERVTVRARLRFRNLPPYFVRRLDAQKVSHPGEPDLGAIVGNLRVYEVAAATTTAQAPRGRRRSSRSSRSPW